MTSTDDLTRPSNWKIDPLRNRTTPDDAPYQRPLDTPTSQKTVMRTIFWMGFGTGTILWLVIFVVTYSVLQLWP